MVSLTRIALFDSGDFEVDTLIIGIFGEMSYFWHNNNVCLCVLYF